MSVCKPGSWPHLSTEIDIDSPGLELQAFSDEDKTEADFDLFDCPRYIPTIIRHISSHGVCDIDHSNGVISTIEQKDMEPEFALWCKAVGDILSRGPRRRPNWPGTMRVHNGKKTWMPDLAKAKGCTELLDTELANIWLVHNE